jgi:trk system potassium uptake protein TrkA
MSKLSVLIIGGGKVGSYLASLLLNEGHQPRIIEIREEIVERLKRELPPDVVMFGSGTAPDVLETASIRRADVVAAVTGADETNLVVASLARFEFEVKRVITRVNDPKNAWLFTPQMGVGAALNQAELLGRLIVEEMSVGDMMTPLKLRRGQYSLIEERVHPASRAAGQPVREPGFRPDGVLVAVIRDGEVTIPHGSTVLESGDEVIALTHVSQLGCLGEIHGER